MADSLATLQERRDQLSAAIGSGILSIREADKSVVYQNVGEMRSTLASLDLQIAAASGTKSADRVYPQTNKGF